VLAALGRRVRAPSEAQVPAGPVPAQVVMAQAVPARAVMAPSAQQAAAVQRCSQSEPPAQQGLATRARRVQPVGRVRQAGSPGRRVESARQAAAAALAQVWAQPVESALPARKVPLAAQGLPVRLEQRGRPDQESVLRAGWGQSDQESVQPVGRERGLANQGLQARLG